MNDMIEDDDDDDEIDDGERHFSVNWLQLQVTERTQYQLSLAKRTASASWWPIAVHAQILPASCNPRHRRGGSDVQNLKQKKHIFTPLLDIGSS